MNLGIYIDWETGRSCVYGSNDVQGRQELWKSSVDNKVEKEPWLIAGDFNVVRSSAQTTCIPDATSVEELNECVDQADITELAGHGCVFTWGANWNTGEYYLRNLDQTSVMKPGCNLSLPVLSISKHRASQIIVI
ncbi:hypothetical protein LIER_43872 [Lithospermum erythrorhizon]|uniref:Endonuclease/exonuclease/phosphatase domain-containing protein n=1 Tax=Lithospermum erythrorhizon TaxID=34254 RepID=A0AAV3R2Z3_LITER